MAGEREGCVCACVAGTTGQAAEGVGDAVTLASLRAASAFAAPTIYRNPCQGRVLQSEGSAEGVTGYHMGGVGVASAWQKTAHAVPQAGAAGKTRRLSEHTRRGARFDFVCDVGVPDPTIFLC